VAARAKVAAAVAYKPAREAPSKAAHPAPAPAPGPAPVPAVPVPVPASASAAPAAPVIHPATVPTPCSVAPFFTTDMSLASIAAPADAAADADAAATAAAALHHTFEDAAADDEARRELNDLEVVAIRIDVRRKILRQGLTLAPISAELELTWPLSAQLKLTSSLT